MALSIRDLSLALRSRELSPTEHLRDTLERLRGDTTNSVVTLDEERALAAAATATDEISRGEWRGPLHGVAVGVKDLVDMEGLQTLCGSNVMADSPPATADAPIVTRLREAGAVVVAKLHTQEFAYGPTGDTSASGPALNPHDPTRITGGSSSGPAASVAAGHLALTIGTDTGASVRTPAALCGVVGLKPTRGVLPKEGVFPLSDTYDHVGLLTGDTHSASVAWDVLSRAGGTGGGIQQPGVSGVRVGVLTDAYWQATDPGTRANVAEAVALLEKQGAQITEISTPMADRFAKTYFDICNAEAYATHRAWLKTRRSDYQPGTLERLEPNDHITASEYVDAQRARLRLTTAMRQACDAVDVLVLATTRQPATPLHATTVPIDGKNAPVRMGLLELTMPFNVTGWPAVSVPGPSPAADGQFAGLPVGVQVVGVRLEERGVLRVAAAIERA
ncbi:MAG: amidase [Pseudonocardia sp.]|uniref:amidase n=1 Tax=unclassified Pseudonocardia TaxID=2619320 RepID=UPI00086B0B54|nr:MULTISPECIES: amidase [unclassified Pseudonocardia]MBN9111831.1 amidase [Pseudonocardia sp.]ODV06811.1 MAG: amidase [Pseudonocardia sp. SCN 73-27]